MKRQNTASPDRWKLRPCRLDKVGAYAICAVETCQRTALRGGFCCIQRISASRYASRARPPRRRSSIVLWGTPWEIIDIQPVYCTIMIYSNEICRLTPALLIFHEIFRNIMGKMLKWKIGRFSRNGGNGRAEICHQGEKSASTFSRQEKYDKTALAVFGRFR